MSKLLYFLGEVANVTSGSASQIPYQSEGFHWIILVAIDFGGVYRSSMAMNQSLVIHLFDGMGIARLRIPRLQQREDVRRHQRVGFPKSRQPTKRNTFVDESSSAPPTLAT
jgi:hypothetical protein